MEIIVQNSLPSNCLLNAVKADFDVTSFHEIMLGDQEPSASKYRDTAQQEFSAPRLGNGVHMAAYVWDQAAANMRTSQGSPLEITLRPKLLYRRVRGQTESCLPGQQRASRAAYQGCEYCHSVDVEMTRVTFLQGFAS